MQKIVVSLLMFVIAGVAVGQTPVNVIEQSLKVNALGGEQVLYLGFAEGDEIIFNYREANGKELKEVEIIEYPTSVKFGDYKTKKVENKRIAVNKTGIYKFRFYNSSLGGKVAKVTIQRVPATAATKHFNTTVYWKTLYDTTYNEVQERYPVKSDTAAVQFYSQTVKIAAKTTTPGSNKAVMELHLPSNTVAWAYYLGVGDEGKEAHYAAREKFLTTAGCDNKMSGYGAMAALAINGSNVFPSAAGREYIKYSFINDQNNVLLFQQDRPFQQYKRGTIISDAAKMSSPMKGKVYLGLANDNGYEVDVLVKATAIVVNQEWNTRTVTKMNVARREEPYLKN